MRGKRAPQRKIQADPVYKNVVVTKFINYVMLHGKRNLAEKAVYEALDHAGKTLKVQPLEVLDKALANVRPSLELRSRRVGGANYSVPVPVAESRQVSLGLKWIIKAARKKEGKDFNAFLAEELMNAYKGEGEAVKTRTDTEKMAEANKAFAHFRW